MGLLTEKSGLNPSSDLKAPKASSSRLPCFSSVSLNVLVFGVTARITVVAVLACTSAAVAAVAARLVKACVVWEAFQPTATEM